MLPVARVQLITEVQLARNWLFLLQLNNTINQLRSQSTNWRAKNFTRTDGLPRTIGLELHTLTRTITKLRAKNKLPFCSTRHFNSDFRLPQLIDTYISGIACSASFFTNCVASFRYVLRGAKPLCLCLFL